MTTTATDEKPLYLGHRSRLRERFLVDEGMSMPDYELLELLLTMAIPRRDVKPLAKKLIKTYGDLGKVIHASALELKDRCGLTQNTIVMLKLVSSCALRCSHSIFNDYEDKPVITYWEQLMDHCWQMLAYKEIEEFHVMFFDDELHYLGEKQISMGTVNSTVVHPREIIKAALEKKAVKIILMHNHPSGNSTPSRNDKVLTKNIEELAEMMNLEVFDHLVVGRENVFSFRQHGMIMAKKKEEGKEV